MISPACELLVRRQHGHSANTELFGIANFRFNTRSRGIEGSDNDSFIFTIEARRWHIPPPLGSSY